MTWLHDAHNDRSGPETGGRDFLPGIERCQEINGLIHAVSWMNEKERGAPA